MTCSPGVSRPHLLSPVEERRKRAAAQVLSCTHRPLPSIFLPGCGGGLGFRPSDFKRPNQLLALPEAEPWPTCCPGRFPAHPGPAHARQIRLDLNLLAEASQPCLHNTQVSVGLPRVRGPGAQPEPHSEPAPRLTFPPDVLQRTSVPQDHCPPGPAREALCPQHAWPCPPGPLIP